MPWIVEVQNVKRVFRLGDVEVQALRGVNLKIEAGDFMSIVGPSGSGKTTLLNLIGALDRPTEGKVIVDGVDISKLNDKELADFRSRKVGFTFQFFNLVSRMTALENVELPMALAGFPRKRRRERAKKLLEEVGIGHRASHRPTELSGGEQQRVAIARALVNRPSIVLCDEPTGNIDTKTGDELVQLMKRLNKEQGQTFIIVTHDSTVASATNRIAYIHDGVIAGVKELRHVA